MNLTIATGSDLSSEYLHMREICLRSIEIYCERYPDIERRCYLLEHHERRFSWDKIRHIRGALPETDFVWWIDADAMIIGKQDIRELINPDATLNIAKDENGINCGVMVWKNCAESFGKNPVLLV